MSESLIKIVNVRTVIQPVLIMSQVQIEAETAADPFTADAECPCTQVTLDESLKT